MLTFSEFERDCGGTPRREVDDRPQRATRFDDRDL